MNCGTASLSVSSLVEEARSGSSHRGELRRFRTGSKCRREIVPHRYFFAVVLALAFAASSCSIGHALEFENVEKQTRQFIEWERTIKLTPAQEAIKKEALGAMPAPCCSNNSAYTCCCPCNLSRSMWGLANYMIAKQNAGVKAVQAKVAEWVAFVAPNGYSGDTCYTGGCPRPFHRNGCGGMKPAQLVF